MKQKKKKLKFSYCTLVGATFTLPLVIVVTLILYLYDKFAIAICDIFVPIYKYLGVYDRSFRHILAIGAELTTIAVIISLLAFVGWLVLRVVKKRRVKWLHKFLENIPVVNSIFSPVKQAVDSLLGSGIKDGKRKVARLTYPTEPYKTIGIVMDEDQLVDHEDRYWVMVPFTMSPGTGLMLSVPKKDVEILPYSVAEALEFSLSCGMARLSKKKVLNKTNFVKTPEQFWDAIGSEQETIRIKLPPHKRSSPPSGTKLNTSMACRLIYSIHNSKIKNETKGKKYFLSLSSFLQFNTFKICNMKKMKLYSCDQVKTDDGEVYLELRRKTA